MKRIQHKYEDFKECFTKEEFDLMMEIQDLLYQRTEIQMKLYELINRLKEMEHE